MGRLGKRRAEAALERHLEEPRFSTPQQQQLTAEALCQGVAAGDPAWVTVLTQVVSSAPHLVQAQLAAHPGLIKGLEAFLAQVQLSSRPAGQATPARAGSAVEQWPAIKLGSSSTANPAEHGTPPQQQQQGDSNCSPEGTTPPISTQNELEAAATALADLLQACEGCTSPPYQDLRPALQAALRHRLATLPLLVQALLRHHSSDMVRDLLLLADMLRAAGQGQVAAVGGLALLAPQVFQELEEGHPGYRLLRSGLAALLAQGTTAGATLLHMVPLSNASLLEVPGILEAACSGLTAACRQLAAAGDEYIIISSAASSSRPCSRSRRRRAFILRMWTDAYNRLLGHLRGLVAAVVHLAAHARGPAWGSMLAAPGGVLVQALAEAVHHLLAPQQVWEWECQEVEEQPNLRDYAAVWGSLLRLSEHPGTAEVLGALFQQQQDGQAKQQQQQTQLYERLAASWEVACRDSDASDDEDYEGCVVDLSHYEEEDVVSEGARVAARLATALLLGGQVPGQEQRRQHRRLLDAAVQLWDFACSYDHWKGHVQQLMELLALPHGPAIVLRAEQLMELICEHELWWPEHEHQGWSLLLALPEFCAEVLAGVWEGREQALMAVDRVLHLAVPEHCQVLAGLPDLAPALVHCCLYDDCAGVNGALESMLSSEPGWEFLEQHPELLQALVTRLDTNRSFVEQVVDLLLHWADCDDDMVWWVLGQPLLMEAVLRMLVKHDSWGCTEVVKWLQGDPSLMEALLRQPPLVADVLLGLVHHKRRHQRLALASATGDEYEFPCIQQLLVEGLATPDFVARALAVMLGLLGSGSDQLSAGVFEAMGIIQRKLRSHPSSARVVWGRELAVVAAKAAPVLQATEQLQALRQVVVEVQGAAAAATHALEHKQQQRRQQQEAAERQLEVKAGDKLQQSCRSTTPRARAQRQRRQQVQQGVRGAAPQGPGPVVLAAAAFRKKPAREQQLPNRQ